MSCNPTHPRAPRHHLEHRQLPLVHPVQPLHRPPHCPDRLVDPMYGVPRLEAHPEGLLRVAHERAVDVILATPARDESSREAERVKRSGVLSVNGCHASVCATPTCPVRIYE